MEREKCKKCGGTGQDNPPPGAYHGLCDECDGSGEVEQQPLPERCPGGGSKIYDNGRVLKAIEDAETTTESAEELLMVAMNLFVSALEMYEAGDDLPFSDPFSHDKCFEIRQWFEFYLTESWPEGV